MTKLSIAEQIAKDEANRGKPTKHLYSGGPCRKTLKYNEFLKSGFANVMYIKPKKKKPKMTKKEKIAKKKLKEEKELLNR